MKKPRVDKDALLLNAEVDNALARGELPKINGWRITDSNHMAVTVRLGAVTFAGLLPATPVHAASSPAVAAAVLREEQAHLQVMRAQHGGGPTGIPRRDQIDDVDLPPPPPSAARALEMALREDHEGESNAMLDQRRAATALEYERLLVSGPPPGAKCALCHGEEMESVSMRYRGPGGKSLDGLGSLMLIRASAVSNAWVHDQCARWSPEVHDPA